MCVFCNLSSPLQKGVTLNVVIHIQIILSVVADKENPKGDRLLVRSRIAGDIEEVFPSADVMETPYADYRFRAWLPRSDLTQALSLYVEGLDYTNFKNSVGDKDRIRPLMQVWSTMHEHQEAQLKAHYRKFI